MTSDSMLIAQLELYHRQPFVNRLPSGARPGPLRRPGRDEMGDEESSSHRRQAGGDEAGPGAEPAEDRPIEGDHQEEERQGEQDPRVGPYLDPHRGAAEGAEQGEGPRAERRRLASRAG